MPGGVILLEEASTSCWDGCLPGSMVDASGSSPGGLVFAVYFSPGGGGLFSSASDHGFVSASCALHGTAMETSGLCTFSGNIGLEICWLEQAWAALVESAKATGYVLLLGAGGLLCYKFYSAHKDRFVSGMRAFFLRPMRGLSQTYRERWRDGQEEDEEDLFDLYEVDISLGLNCLSIDHRPKRKLSKGVYIADQIRTRWRHVTLRRERAVQQLSLHQAEEQQQPIRRYFSTPEGLVRLQGETYSIAQHWQQQRMRMALGDPLSGRSSGESSPIHVPQRFRSHSLSIRDHRCQGVPPDSGQWSPWDSMVFADSVPDVSDLSRLIRECSVDSDGSEFSLDVSLNEGCGLSTLRVIQRIEEEINSVKSNCLAMNQELVTLRDEAAGDGLNGLGQLSPMLPIDQLTRASFRRLLNLTVIPDEASDTASEAEHPIHGREEEDPFSMEWDNEDLPTAGQQVVSGAGLLQPTSGVPSGGVWGSQESGYLEWEGTPSTEVSATSIVLSPLLEKKEQSDESSEHSTTAFSSCLNSPDDRAPSSTSDAASGVKRRQWVEASQENRDSAIFDLGLDLEAAWREEAVGLTVQLIHYAMDTWQAHTPRAHSIQQAYLEVEQMSGCRRMRRVRADHYGVLRAALCGMVLNQIPMPQACQAMRRISREMDRGSGWIRSWTFGHRLPYGPDNVLQGMAECLETMDRTMSEVMTEKDPMESLVARLNADVLLDTRLMEAIKLHVLGAALSLELAGSLGETLPLFALALFARPDSKSARDLALNYLNPIGDASTLERAEYYLLAYALGVRLDVYRPTAVVPEGESGSSGSMDLRTSYPDWESFTRFVSVIEEDERHYCVPVP